MTRTEAPKMQVSKFVAVAFHGLAQLIGNAFIRIHVEQNRAGIANETIRPAGDDERSTMPASGSIHNQPNAPARIKPHRP
jgi:hypothetical protein